MCMAFISFSRLLPISISSLLSKPHLLAEVFFCPPIPFKYFFPLVCFGFHLWHYFCISYISFNEFIIRNRNEWMNIFFFPRNIFYLFIFSSFHFYHHLMLICLSCKLNKLFQSQSLISFRWLFSWFFFLFLFYISFGVLITKFWPYCWV